MKSDLVAWHWKSDSFQISQETMVQLVINSKVLILPAVKRVEFINFSGPKRSFGRRDSADCKHREMKWSVEGAERVLSQPASMKLCCSLRAAGFPWGRLRWDSLSDLRRYTSSHAACNRHCRAVQSFALVSKN